MNNLLVTHPTTCRTVIAHINIWDDYSEETKLLFHGKKYHTYTYIEQIVQSNDFKGSNEPVGSDDFEQLNCCDFTINDEVAIVILSHLRSLLIENNIFSELELFIHYFDAYEFFRENNSNSHEDKVKVNDKVNSIPVSLFSKLHLLFRKIIFGKSDIHDNQDDYQRFKPSNYQRYELCFTDLSYDKLMNVVLPFLNSKPIELVIDDICYKLNFYSES